MRDIFDEKKVKLMQSIKEIQAKKQNMNSRNNTEKPQQMLKRNFIEVPGMYSMDKNLQLPPEEPIRKNSKEPILHYSQKRDYDIIIQHTDICGNSNFSFNDLNFEDLNLKTDVFLLMVVKSSCKLKARRDAIRETWGNETWVKENTAVNVRLLFLLGACTSKQQEEKVKDEDQQHRDILQWNFFDSFRNLTLKDCLFLQWITRNCQNVPYIFKGDDDVFVNTKNIVQHLINLPKDKRRDLFLGSVLLGSVRILDPTWKYYVSYNLYPEKIYPPYVSGGGFIMSSNMAIRLFNATLSSRIIPIDDAFLGIMLKKIKVHPQNDKTFKSWGLKKTTVCRLSKIKTYHKVLPKNLKTLWNSYINLNLSTCAKDTNDVFVTQTKR